MNSAKEGFFPSFEASNFFINLTFVPSLILRWAFPSITISPPILIIPSHSFLSFILPHI
ncbi:MAG: hypothetical protein ABIM29_02885 [candidate division WOR-3 bacterium]